MDGYRVGATRIYSDVLAAEPENTDALRYFLNLYKFSPDKAQNFYVKLMAIYIKADFEKAVEIFDEYYPVFTKALPEENLLRLGTYYFRCGAFEKARYCFEICSDKELGKSKGLLWLGRTFQAIGNAEMASRAYKAVIEQFPNTLFSKEARNHLASIEISDALETCE